MPRRRPGGQVCCACCTKVAPCMLGHHAMPIAAICYWVKQGCSALPKTAVRNSLAQSSNCHALSNSSSATAAHALA